MTQHAIASDGSPWRIGVKRNLMVIPAKRAAETLGGYPDEGNKVLKCLDVSVYATLFGLSVWAFE